MKKVIIFSHERSGTHFLLNTIAKNFGLNTARIDFHGENNLLPASEMGPYIKRVIDFLKRQGGKQTDKIYKAHHQGWFFKNCQEDLFDEFIVFYMVRDPRDVFTSCFHYFNNTAAVFPKTRDIRELIFQLRPPDYANDGRYSIRKSESFLERWIKHVQSWLQYGDKVNVVTYHDLAVRLDTTVRRIAPILGKPAPAKVFRPPVNFNSVYPRKGVEGDWRKHIKEKDSLKIKKAVTRSGLARFLV